MISRFYLLLVSLRAIYCLFIAAFFLLNASGFTQENSRSAFAVLNIVPKDLLIKIALDMSRAIFMSKSFGTILRTANALLLFSWVNPEAFSKKNAAMKRQ